MANEIKILKVDDEDLNLLLDAIDELKDNVAYEVGRFKDMSEDERDDIYDYACDMERRLAVLLRGEDE